MQADAHFEVKRVHSGRILTQRSAFAGARLGVACEFARDGLGPPGISAALSGLASLTKPQTGCLRVRGFLFCPYLCHVDDGRTRLHADNMVMVDNSWRSGARCHHCAADPCLDHFNSEMTVSRAPRQPGRSGACGLFECIEMRSATFFVMGGSVRSFRADGLEGAAIDG